ncbi:MAG TPA: sigma-54 dependent transcriptional regulator [Methylomirabilota bacterium]|nr:sigma-54 dependent transcriptional regulator [Methylomirabilota bacterium]
MRDAGGATLLVVDDEPDMRSLLEDIFTAERFRVVTVADGADAPAAYRRDRPAVVLLDLVMPRVGGMETLQELRQLDPSACIIILTAFAEIPKAVQAMRLGAYDYLTKPFVKDELVLTVQRALEHRGLVARVAELENLSGPVASLRALMGPSAAVTRVITAALEAAAALGHVTIEGEPGTGKELIARTIHQQSARRDHPFVTLDCGAVAEAAVESELFGYEKGAIPGAERSREGQLQRADGGTLFLDEVAALPAPIQSRLLRALRERKVQPLGGARAVPVDVRVLAASRASLEHEVRAGRLRQDLASLLGESTVSVPPLRERREDIMALANRFAEEMAMERGRPVRGISESAWQLLLAHAWPGNARELRDVIRRAVLRCEDVVEPDHLWPRGRRADAPASRHAPGGLSLRELAELGAAEAEQQAIREALRASRGNKSAAARLLKTDYKTLHVKMRQYAITGEDFRPA